VSEPTSRELAVLDAAIRLGYTGAARQLGVRRTTVQSTLANVRAKLDARSTADAYRIARDRGLIAARVALSVVVRA
jgi:DNA-binding NarL/FixJ family response regulator